jgi:hypothetical protein
MTRAINAQAPVGAGPDELIGLKPLPAVPGTIVDEPKPPFSEWISDSLSETPAPPELPPEPELVPEPDPEPGVRAAP